MPRLRVPEQIGTFEHAGFGAVERVTRTVGRKVNLTVYTVAEFSKRTRTENAFVTRVLEQPKLWVIGSEHDLPIAA